MSTLLALSARQQQQLQQRLAALAAEAPGGALLSVTLALDAHQAGSGDWLSRQPAAAEHCYWARPAQGEYRLGIGRAVVCTSGGPARFTALQAAHDGMAQHWRHDDGDATGHAPIACLGFAFDEESIGELPNAQLGVPAVLLRTLDGRSSATFTTPARELNGALTRWQKLLQTRPSCWRPVAAASIAESGDLASANAATGRHDHTALARRAWRARVNAALAAIERGTLDKVVLSRSLRLALPAGARPAASLGLLRSLVARHPESTVFAMGNQHACFVGATPERLVRLADGRACADALAGTAWAEHSLAGRKNADEQKIVVEAVHQAMQPLCTALSSPAEPTILQVRHLQHLWTPVEGKVRPGVGLFDLIARLHPTPAVGGWPKAAAGEWLRRHGEKRGSWYGGGIGWIDAGGAGEIAVALRCGLIAGSHIELSAGAGIVAGSEAMHEFAETEAKLATMLGALTASDIGKTGETAKTDEARTGTQ